MSVLKTVLTSAASCVLLSGCVSPYSARSYRNVDTSILYAIICHDGKRTIRIPADEWPEHKGHHDYRGPCRARGIPTPSPEPKPKHTVAEYDNRKARRAWSEEEWARHQEAQLQLKGEQPASVQPASVQPASVQPAEKVPR